MSFRDKFLITLLAVLAVLLAIAAYGYFTGAWESDDNNAHIFGLASAETKPELCMDDESRERVRKLMLEALDESLKQKIQDLFAVWLRDATGQPARASKGLDSALRAYMHAFNSAEAFNPPVCS